MLRIRGLRKSFASPGGERIAVDGVDLELAAGELVGLVGESGCGKTTLGRLAVRLIEPDAGSVEFGGQDLLRLGAGELRRARSRFQMIFQDAGAALDPRMRVAEALAEPLTIHRHGVPGERRKRVEELLGEVGLGREMLDRFPHELSGGQKQRVGIARALAMSPELLVADEAVSALDLSLQGQVVNLLLDLQARLGLAILFISHDLRLVCRIVDRVLVMFAGAIVEECSAHDLLVAPQHPHSLALLQAAGGIGRMGRAAGNTELAGFSALTPSSGRGCRYAQNCPIVGPRCLAEVPLLGELFPGHRVACHDPGRLRAESAPAGMEPFAALDVMNNNAKSGANQ